MDKKTIIIIALATALLVVGWIAFKKDPVPYDKEFLQKQIKKLDSANMELRSAIVVEQNKVKKYEALNDSLIKLEPIIKIKYVTIYKNIDSASAPAILNQFKDVFSNNHG